MRPDEALALMTAHASCRRYRPTPLPDGLLERLVAAAQQASTDATGQLYSIVRVADPALRAKVAPLAGGQDHVAVAPEFLVVCIDTRRLRRLLEHRGERYGMEPAVALLFGVTDAALMAQNLALAAESHGLGVCFIGGVQNGGLRIAELLDLPKGVLPLWGMTLGEPDAPSQPKPRVPTRLVLHTDRYRDPEPEDLDAAYERMAAATRSGDWVHAIRKYFATGGIMAQREEAFRRLLARQGFPLD